MEFRGVYVLWAMLPAGYLCLCIWVFLRPIFKVSGREKVDHYYPSLLWTGGCLALAIVVDNFGVVEAVFSLLVEIGLFDPELQMEILRFLLYPAVLVAVAQAQKVINQEDSDKKRNLPKSRWR